VSIPLSFDEITIWLALVSIILLAASEVLSSYYGRTHVFINRKRLKNVSLVMSLMFLVSIAAKVAEMLLL
jgi:hypothetical protein